MPKSGQARVPTAEQQHHLFDVIQHHRHPEKNTAIMQISFKLGLRAQEISLLQVKEVARLNSRGTDFKLLEVMSLPAAYTKGAGAMKRSKSHYQRKTISFEQSLEEASGATLVKIGRIGQDRSDFRVEHEPGHPAADEKGFVKYPNVSVLIEMADMREANRSYEANLQVVKQVREMVSLTIDLLRR